MSHSSTDTCFRETGAGAFASALRASCLCRRLSAGDGATLLDPADNGGLGRVAAHADPCSGRRARHDLGYHPLPVSALFRLHASRALRDRGALQLGQGTCFARTVRARLPAPDLPHSRSAPDVDCRLSAGPRPPIPNSPRSAACGLPPPRPESNMPDVRTS